jgi:hypothetical protein
MYSLFSTREQSSVAIPLNSKICMQVAISSDAYLVRREGSGTAYFSTSPIIFGKITKRVCIKCQRHHRGFLYLACAHIHAFRAWLKVIIRYRM